jgi:alpha-methylacyl-CoA racemase
MIDGANAASGAGMSWLRGVRILDCTRLLPHAYATQMLVALGADVIKIESPARGEYGRSMPETFASSNGSKRSLTLNIRSEEGRGILRELAARSHGFVESFRPGVMAGIGLGYDDLSALNPSLVYCSATGYGQYGPGASVPGHDLNYLARAGGVTGDGSVQPALVPFPLVDMATAPFVGLALVAAIGEARSTGRGQFIDLSLFEVALSMNLMGLAYTSTRTAPDEPGRPARPQDKLDGFPWPHILVGGCPSYGVFRTADGETITLCNVEDKFWTTFCSIVGLRCTPEERFATGARADEIRDLISRVIAGEPLAHWIAAFSGQDVCFAPAMPSGRVLADEHVRARDSVFLESDGSVQVRFPAKFSLTPARDGGLPPEAGQHSDDLLAELGYDAEARRRLREAGVV